MRKTKTAKSTLTPERVVATARAQLGVSYSHQGRSLGEFLDCNGLVICSLLANGWKPHGEFALQNNYQRLAADDRMTELVAEECHKIEFEELKPADIVILHWPGHRFAQHMGMITDAVGPYFIHAYQGAGVVEHALKNEWRDWVRSCWRLRCFH